MSLVDLPTFDPRTAYKGDYQWFDWVENAALETPTAGGEPNILDGLHARREDLNTTDFIGLTAGLSLSSSAAGFAVWPPVASDSDEVVELDIRPGCILRIAAGSEEAGEGWMVQAHARSRFGHYALVCDKEAVNAPA